MEKTNRSINELTGEEGRRICDYMGISYSHHDNGWSYFTLDTVKEYLKNSFSKDKIPEYIRERINDYLKEINIDLTLNNPNL